MDRTLPLVALAAVVVAACTPAAAPPRSASAAGGGAPIVAGAPAEIVDGETARRLLADGVKVVDVRTQAEFAAGHVPGAVNIPYDELPARAAEIGPPSAPVLLYCRSGRRSGIAARSLQGAGFSKVYDLQTYDRWVAAEQGAAGR